MPKRIDDDDYIVVRDIADDGPEDEGRAVNEVKSLKATHLPPTVDEEELRSIFGRALCSVQLPRNSNGEGVGYAILGFASSEEAARAMQRNGQRMPERKAVLRLAPCSVASGRRPMLSYQVCVGNLHPSIQDAQLYEAFRPLSEEVVGARVPSEQGRNRGFGFLRLSDDEHLEEFIKAAHGFQLAGRGLTVKPCLMAEASSDRALFVTHLDPGTTEQWLRSLLGVFGEVQFVERAVSGGFARIGFTEAEAAMAAASLLQGRAQSSGRKMVFRWAKEQGAGRDRPIDYRDLTGFSQRFATPLSDAPTDNYGREMAQSLMPAQGSKRMRTA